MGCAQVTSLGLRKHQFGVQPSKIIWIQVAGLEEEHLAMLKNTMPTTRELSLERANCFGKLWNFNLYDLRPDPGVGLNIQITGSKNINHQCSDFEQRPLWDYLAKSGYESGYFENGANAKDSLYGGECADQKEKFSQGLTRWISSAHVKRASGDKIFHVSEAADPFEEGGVYLDRSCSKKGCFTNLLDNAVSTYKRFSKNKNFYSYIIRDFTYYEAMKNKNFNKAKSILLEVDKLVSFFSKEENLSDTLIIVSSTASIGIELPTTARSWKSFEKTGNAASYRSHRLMSSVFAFGARAENFCGVYEEVELFKRTLSGPKQQGLEFIIVNPFQ